MSRRAHSARRAGDAAWRAALQRSGATPAMARGDGARARRRGDGGPRLPRRLAHPAVLRPPEERPRHGLGDARSRARFEGGGARRCEAGARVRRLRARRGRSDPARARIRRRRTSRSPTATISASRPITSRPIAAAGLVGLAFGNSPAAMPAWGGKRALFGTNPIAAVFPRRDDAAARDRPVALGGGARQDHGGGARRQAHSRRLGDRQGRQAHHRREGRARGQHASGGRREGRDAGARRSSFSCARSRAPPTVSSPTASSRDEGKPTRIGQAFLAMNPGRARGRGRLLRARRDAGRRDDRGCRGAPSRRAAPAEPRARRARRRERARGAAARRSARWPARDPCLTASGRGFQACVRTPFATLGITATDTHVTGVRFLAPGVAALAPKKNSIAFLACVQIQAYLENPAFEFDLPLKLAGTRHRLAVWEAMQRIPAGKTRTYGELAAELRLLGARRGRRVRRESRFPSSCRAIASSRRAATSAASWARAPRASSSASSAGSWGMKALSEADAPRARPLRRRAVAERRPRAQHARELPPRRVRSSPRGSTMRKARRFSRRRRADLQRHLAWQVESQRRQAAHHGPAGVVAEALLPVRASRGIARRRSHGGLESPEAAALAAEVALGGRGRGAPRGARRRRRRRDCATARCWRRSTRAGCASPSWWD